MTETTTAPENVSTPPTTDSVEAWADRSVHKGVTLPSGAVVDIKLPNLTEFAKEGHIPNELLGLVTKVAQGEELGDDMLAHLDDLHRFLVASTVVKPAVTEADVNKLPPEDISTLVEFALRQRDTDIVGHHIAGLEAVASFRRFRNLPSLDESLIGL